MRAALGIAVFGLCATLAPAQTCSPVMLCDFESWSPGAEVLFRPPRFSQSTSTHLAPTPDTAAVVADADAADGGRCSRLAWAFTDAGTQRWVRVTTFDAPAVPNPTVDLTLPIRLRVRFDSPSSAVLRVALGIRETGTSASIGQNGGTSGTIEWVGASSTISGAPQGRLLYAFPGVWQTLLFDPAGDGVLAFTGNGTLSSATGKGTLEHLAFAGTGSAGPFTVHVDTVEQLCSVPPARTGDFDRDADVDMSDFTYFQACVTGPATGQIHPACTGADFDCDGAVDQSDFGIFQRCLSGDTVPALADCSGLSPIPPRPPGAITGSAFVAQVWSTPKATREQMVRQQILGGNLPPFLRNFVPVSVTASIGGVARTAVYEVMPDYLAIGSDADFIRMPMGPLTAQPIADAFQCVLPTRKMVNDIYAAASVKLAPHPFSPSVYNIESVDVFNQSNQYIEGQRAAAGAPLGALVAGTKKDVVITPRLVTEPNKVAIYGWHQLNGQPIQPLYLGHEITYMDYSHGIRLVKQRMRLDGNTTTVQEVLADPALCVLLSDEGVLTRPRY